MPTLLNQAQNLRMSSYSQHSSGCKAGDAVSGEKQVTCAGGRECRKVTKLQDHIELCLKTLFRPAR